ncbi:MAG: AAA family ATPase [Deltaproteobacteria bacterium]|nr:AAA family ATPase [Deltaproteobacteria bacterium]
MRHFGEARRDAAAAVLEPGVLDRCEQLCLLWDVAGRLRVLVKPAAGNDEGVLRSDLGAALAAACGSFWSGEVWVRGAADDTAARRVYEAAWRLARPLSPAGASGGEVRELDRHLSKETWFGEPRTPPWPLQGQTPPIIAFYSFKGGVGRTTALVALALQLARAKKRVCVVDLDLEAPGVGVLLAPTSGPARYGVVDFLVEHEVSAAGKIDLGEYFHLYDDPRALGEGPPIAVVPAGTLDGDYLEKLARIDYQRLLQPEHPNEPALEALLKRLRAARQADYVLLDSRAGLHDLGGLALNGIAHLDVLFALDNEQSWQGLGLVVDHLGRRRVERGLEQQSCMLVQAMALAATDPNRKGKVEEFRDRAYELFSDAFYDQEPSAGWPDPLPEDVWPIPAVDVGDEPHTPVPIGFQDYLLRPWTVDTAAQVLTQGDFGGFAEALLARVGRSSP